MNDEPDIQVNPAPESQEPAQPESTTLYSSDDPANQQVDLAAEGFDLNVKQVEPQTELAEGSVVDSIVGQTTADKTEEDRILQELETMDQQLDMEVPIAPIAAKANRNAKLIFILVLVLSLAIVGYFYINKKGLPVLGIEPSTTLEASVTSLSDIRSEKAFQDLKSAALMIRDVSYDIGEFSVQLQLSGPLSKTNLTSLRGDIYEKLIAASELMKRPAVLYEQAFNAKDKAIVYMADEVSEEEGKLENLTDPELREELQAKVGLMRDAHRMGAVEGFEKTISEELEAHEEMTDEEFLVAVTSVLSEVLFSDHAKIAHVQATRVNWSEVIAEIERATQTVVPDFSIDTQQGDDGITYTSFAFNAADNRVNVSGTTSTDDIKTFTRIADLTDAMEASDTFMGVDNRTFSKQKSEEFGYTSTIRFDFFLESNEDL